MATKRSHTLTIAERARIKEIRDDLKRSEEDHFNIKMWEATFFLKILDRLKIK